MAKTIYDAIVIGSGISGGWAAKELSEKGLKVLMLERGPHVEHVKGYVNAMKSTWEFPHRGERTQQTVKDYPVLTRSGFAPNETNHEFWTNEKENPYTEVKRFDWYRGYQTGGRSLLWGRQCYRWNKWDFEANLKEGIAVDWPIRYEDLAPWYSYVEKFSGIQGSKEGLEVLPDGEFMPPMEMNVAEKWCAANLRKAFNNTRHMFIGRSANITVPHHDRSNCLYRNKCWLGCPFGAYFSTQSATLPAAMATGNLTLQNNAIVTQIIYDKDKKRATGVEVVDALTHKSTQYFSKIIFLCASSFNSTWVLMNSATNIWPDGLGSSSGELGHNVMDHHFRTGAEGIVDGFEDKYEYGRRPTGIYIPRYRNIYNDKRNYLRGFGYQGGASRNRGIEVAEFTLGAGLKEALSEPGPWKMWLLAFGEMLPSHKNRIFLDKNRKDKWGLPVLAMDVEMGDNEKKMRKDMKDDAGEILEKSGCKKVEMFDWGYAPGQGIHEMGTARMGRDPKTSVLNAHNQIWDAPNVFVTDGACMTSASCVNPSITYMALTARAADFAVRELKKGNL